MPYTMEDYIAARSAHDYPNATAIWDALAVANDTYLRGQNKDRFNPKLPAIFPAFMPNSGGDTFARWMEYAFGYVEFHWAVTRPDKPTEAYPAPAAVDVYGRGGYFCRSMARPTPFFRMVMHPRVTRPIWVHLRHPAEACHAAWLATVQPLRAKAGAEAPSAPADPSTSRGKPAHKGARPRLVTTGVTPPPPPVDTGPSFDAYMRTHLPTYVGWLEDWLAYAAEFPDRAVFSSFDELGDINATLTRIFAAQGFAVDFSGVPDPFGPGNRPTDTRPDWRADLGEGAVDLVGAADGLWASAQAQLPAKATPKSAG